jgi:DNA polymerase elongation subunit (family B)
MTTEACFIYDWSVETLQQWTRIRLFGLTEDHQTVSLSIDDFETYVYIELPSTIEWDASRTRTLCQYLRTHIFRQVPSKIQLKWRSKLYYVQDQPSFPYLKCSFRRVADRDALRGVLKSVIEIPGWEPIQLKVHEESATPILQLACTQHLPMSGWITFQGTELMDRETTAQREWLVSYTSMKPDVTHDVTPIPTCLSFDLEVYSSNPNKMPCASVRTDCIFQISCVFWSATTKPTRYLLTLGNPDLSTLEEIHVLSYQREAGLLQGWVDLIHEWNPHVITGYNILGFDMPYLLERADLYGMESVYKMGMIRDRVCERIHQTWASSAYGAQEFQYLDSAGRVFIDLLVYARREFKFSSYKLDSVAGHFLNAKKDPLTARDIFQSYELGMTGSQEGQQALATCGRYCVQDSILVQQLFDLFETWIGMTEMARVCHIPNTYLYTKGQQIKVFSQVYKYCYDHKIVVESNAYQPDGREEYQGATVLDPVPGLYEYVVPFDFKSLYPTIMIAYNIDYRTFVHPDRADQVPDDQCHVVEWIDHQSTCSDASSSSSDTCTCPSYRYKFLREPKGVLPTILEHLLDARAATRTRMKQLKSDMANETDPHVIQRTQVYLGILNKRQLSYKVSSNSMYGALGVRRGYLPCMPLAMSITAMGRYNLNRAATHLRSLGATIVYGDTDSCYVQFPDVPPEQLWAHARALDRQIQQDGIFPSPMVLEFEEAVYGQFLILSKKRYMWRDYTEQGTLDSTIGKKGVLLARRDNSGFVRALYHRVVQMIFDQCSFSQVIEEIIEEFNRCGGRVIPLDQFLISKSVNDTSGYKVRPLPEDPEKRLKRLQQLHCTEKEYLLRALPAHVQLAEKMKRRGVRVDAGQRIDYVVTSHGGPKAILSDKIEDPEYRDRFPHLFPIDTLYYMHACTVPLDQLLETAYVKERHLPPTEPVKSPESTELSESSESTESHLKQSKRPLKVKRTYRPVDGYATQFIEFNYRLRLHRYKLHQELLGYFRIRIHCVDSTDSEESVSEDITDLM